MTTAVTVRPATVVDAASVLALRAAVFAETDYMLWEPAEFKDTVEDEASRIFRFNSSKNSCFLIATVDGAPIGFCGVMGGGVNRLRHSASIAIGVLREHWGQGAGNSLLQAAVSFSIGAGLTRIELTVHTTNIKAIALYLRNGFEVEGRRRRSLRVAGEYVDEYLMSLLHEA